MAAMDPLQAKANYSRICQLLIDKGGDALRAAFHVIHSPPSLAAVLNANKSALKKIRYSVINSSQWNLLFPPSGTPDSKHFDITLLTILLRSICGLTSPAAGWNAMPSAGDASISADILRIKFFRNQVYGHIASAQLDDTTFETLWQEISKPLVKLGIRQQDIDEAKVASLSPEEESYIEKLKQWKELENALVRHESVLIIVDALDESKSEVKSDFLQLISEEFSELPQWVKILITSRPELQVRKQLEHFNPVEIRPDDRHHTRDLKHFVQQCLPNLNEGNVNRLISKCEGSFLYAYYVVNELQKRDLGIEPNLNELAPKGISGFYEKQFKRLQTGLLNVNPDTGLSVFRSFLNVVAASKNPLPIKILYIGIGLSNEEYKVRETIINIMSEILPLYDSCLTVYHKPLWDWLTLNGYQEHAFKADVEDGVKRLWLACKSIYIDIESLGSVSHFSLTPERMFALQNGGKYLLDVGDAEDFRWFVHIR